MENYARLSQSGPEHKGLVHTSRRQFTKILGVSLLGIGVGGCEFLGLYWRYRYRLTGTVESAGRYYSGSSVIEVVRDRGYDGIGGKSYGDAVTIDVPNIGPLFMLLSSELGQQDWPFTMPHRAFARQLGSVDMVNPTILDRLTHLQGAKAILVPKLYPAFGRFKVISDPRTFQKLDPAALAADFSPGIRLQEISIEITDDPVTRGIEKRLPWLDHLDDYRVNPEISVGTTLPSEISWFRNR